MEVKKAVSGGGPLTISKDKACAFSNAKFSKNRRKPALLSMQRNQDSEATGQGGGAQVPKTVRLTEVAPRRAVAARRAPSAAAAPIPGHPTTLRRETIASRNGVSLNQQIWPFRLAHVRKYAQPRNLVRRNGSWAVRICPCPCTFRSVPESERA